MPAVKSSYCNQHGRVCNDVMHPVLAAKSSYCNKHGRVCNDVMHPVLAVKSSYYNQHGRLCNDVMHIHVNPKRKFRGTKWRPAERSETSFGRGVRGSSPVNVQKPVLQMVQSDVFLSYI